MLLSWLRNRRRKKMLAQPFPREWLRCLADNVALYRQLSESEQHRLQGDLRVFVAEKYWEGCKGFAITDEVKVTIAAQACSLLLGFEHDYFARVKTILIYPGSFRRPAPQAEDGLLVNEHAQPVDGEAWYRGPVILAWDRVVDEGRNPQGGRNVVFHEFAHQLDMLNGSADGVPPLPPEAEATWREVMEEDRRWLKQAYDRGEEPLLDDDAVDNEAEMFAVATEFFFCLPREFQQEHPDLYDLLKGFYQQDPAGRE